MVSALTPAVETPNEKDCYLEAVQTRLQNLEKSIPEVLRLEKRNDYQIYQEFQYKTWDSLPPLVCDYLMSRYGFRFGYRLGDKIEDYIKRLLIISSECVGKSFDRYNIDININEHKLKKCLADLTSEQLSEVMEAIVNVLNEKKQETTNDECC